MDAKVVDCLQLVRGKIEKGWIRGEFYRKTSKYFWQRETEAYCLEGALRSTAQNISLVTIEKARTYILAAAGYQALSRRSTAIRVWNDFVPKNKKEVLAVIDAAIRLARVDIQDEVREFVNSLEEPNSILVKV